MADSAPCRWLRSSTDTDYRTRNAKFYYPAFRSRRSDCPPARRCTRIPPGPCSAVSHSACTRRDLSSRLRKEQGGAGFIPTTSTSGGSKTEAAHSRPHGPEQNVPTSRPIYSLLSSPLIRTNLGRGICEQAQEFKLPVCSSVVGRSLSVNRAGSAIAAGRNQQFRNFSTV